MRVLSKTEIVTAWAALKQEQEQCFRADSVPCSQFRARFLAVWFEVTCSSPRSMASPIPLHGALSKVMATVPDKIRSSEAGFPPPTPLSAERNSRDPRHKTKGFCRWPSCAQGSSVDRRFTVPMSA